MGIRGKILAVTAVLGVLAATGAQAEDAKGEAKLAKALEGRTVRAGIPCIDVRKIISTEIFNGTAIVYRLRGSPTLYVNRPTAGAEGLNGNNTLGIEQAVQLCEGMNLMTGDNGGRGGGSAYNGGIQLGEFVPWAKDEAAK